LIGGGEGKAKWLCFFMHVSTNNRYLSGLS
jgi:hypothetical protein